MRLPSRLPLTLAALALLAACVPPDTPSGKSDFDALCSGCHGPTGKGDGDMAAMLDQKPADLTTLSAKNNGHYPGTEIMAQIWGYAKPQGRVMPEFGPLLEGDLVPFDSGDGILTPTPIRLVQLEQYVRGLQGK